MTPWRQHMSWSAMDIVFRSCWWPTNNPASVAITGLSVFDRLSMTPHLILGAKLETASWKLRCDWVITVTRQHRRPIHLIPITCPSCSHYRRSTGFLACDSLVLFAQCPCVLPSKLAVWHSCYMVLQPAPLCQRQNDLWLALYWTEISDVGILLKDLPWDATLFP